MKTSSKARKSKSNARDKRKKDRKPEWRRRVFDVLHLAEEPLALSTIYDRVEQRNPELTRGREFWRARVRATLEGYSDFVRVDRGVWDLSERHSKKSIKAFAKERRELYPLRSESAS